MYTTKQEAAMIARQREAIARDVPLRENYRSGVAALWHGKKIDTSDPYTTHFTIYTLYKLAANAALACESCTVAFSPHPLGQFEYLGNVDPATVALPRLAFSLPMSQEDAAQVLHGVPNWDNELGWCSRTLVWLDQQIKERFGNDPWTLN